MSRFIVLFLLLVQCHTWRAQSREQILDSILKADEPLRGKFGLYIRPFAFEGMVGLYRSRTQQTENFSPAAFTYQIYLPFQLELGYLHFSEKSKLLKLNTILLYQHSHHLNYAMGLSERISILLAHKTYLSYQGGVVWCEVVNRSVNDGIIDMGFSLHHIISLTRELTKNINLSINFSHISSGNLFSAINNNQDVISFGIKYTCPQKR